MQYATDTRKLHDSNLDGFDNVRKACSYIMESLVRSFFFSSHIFFTLSRHCHCQFANANAIAIPFPIPVNESTSALALVPAILPFPFADQPTISLSQPDYQRPRGP
jgi:hypothetical protein